MQLDQQHIWPGAGGCPHEDILRIASTADFGAGAGGAGSCRDFLIMCLHLAIFINITG